ncbi:MAG TPA: carboxypeptidase-like regulatory domain-containing protein [Pyrinomonadaceae bacterium]|nr:carboxypeptidase-like regulatory domain-containing protein [Pyrinomonadaceae bacterium]
MRKSFSIILFLLVAVAAAAAQTTTGRLSGTVSGPDGLLPNATVVARDNKTGKELTATTTDNGAFLFSQLEFGTYTVTITSSGFKTFVVNDVKIDVGREHTLNPTMELGSLSENVTVTAGADVVTATTPQVSNTVSPQQILSLPLVTRNPLSLTGLQAGVAPTAASPFQQTSINGMRTTLTNITRDGINIQDAFIRTNATDFAPGRPSVDDTGEFTITTTNQESDQGYGGAQIRLVTPRGTKDFHGALFAYNRNSEFAANTFFANKAGLVRPFRNRNQFGGKVSGPMWLPGIGEGTPIFHKDKGFFFFNYEGIRDPVSGRFNRTILTPLARAGGFSFNRATAGAPTQFCPSGNQGSVCTIPNLLTYANTLGLAVPTTIDPVTQARIISQLPTESNFSGGDNLNTAGYTLNRQQDTTSNLYTMRFDVDPTDKDNFNIVYSYVNVINLRPDADVNGFSVTPGVIQGSKNKTFVMAYRRILGQSMVNEIRGGIFTSEVPFDRTDPLPDFMFAAGATGLLANLFQAGAFQGGSVSNPENTFMSQGRNTKGFNFQDNADWTIGGHSVRFGGQLQNFKVNSYNDARIVPLAVLAAGNGTPQFTQANFGTIGGISAAQLLTANDMLALFGGLYNTGVQRFNVESQTSGFQPTQLYSPYRYSNHSLYVADRWSVLRGLTLSLGVRYELFPAMKLANGLALEPVFADPDNFLPSLLTINGTTNFIGGNAGTDRAYYKTDFDNFAPSVGFAYTPNFESGFGRLLFGSEGKSVFRGGYSQAYGNDSIVTSINNAAVGNPGLGSTDRTLVNLNGRLAAGGPAIAPPPFVTPPITYLQNAANGNFFGTVFAIDPNVEVPMTEQYSFGWQREFFGNTALEIRYVGSRSLNLVRGVDINQIDIFNNGFLADFNRARANLALSIAANPNNAAAQTAFCAGITPGCVPLQIFVNAQGSTGRLGVNTAAANAPGRINRTTFNNNLLAGTPADLALAYINSAVNLNNHPSSINPAAVPFISFLPNPAAGAIDVMVNDARYNYNSLQIEVRRRFSQGLYFQANYTYSKNLTNAIGTGANLFEPYLDNNNTDWDWQRADFDIPHVFNFNGIYQLPFGRGKMFLDHGGWADMVFGGWELAGIVQWTAGTPITFVDNRGTVNRTGRSGRQTPQTSLTGEEIRALGGVFEQNGTFYFMDPDARSSFTANAPGQTGNTPRAALNSPKFFNIDMALLKNIRFTETMRLQLRAEAFNVLNNVNFIPPATGQLQLISSPTFGQITGTTPARTVQFAARFEF